MKTEVQLTSKQITIEDLENYHNVGFIESDDKKGYIAHLGCNKYIPLCSYGDNLDGERKSLCNFAYEGGAIYDTLRDAVNVFNNLKALFVFDTRKELYQWLAE